MSTILLGSVSGTYAQGTWRRTYGGFDSNIGRSIRQTPDGGFIIAGSTGAFGSGGQAYIIKVDDAGVPEWFRNLGDAGVQTGMACRVIDDGYIVAGSTATGNFGGYDMFMTRLDPLGDVLWYKTYGTSDWDMCNDLEVTSNGFVLAGVSYGLGGGDAFVVRTDFDGDTLWSRTFGGPYLDEILGVCISADDAAILTGSLNILEDGSNADAFVAKVSQSGATSWIRTFGGDSADYFYGAIETTDGGFACSGGTNSYAGVKQVLLVKVSSEGDSLWQEEFGSMGDSEGREIQLTQAGDLAIASYNSFNNAGGTDMVLLLVSSEGGFILGKNYGGLANEDGFSVQCTPDGGYITLGTADGYGPGIRSIYVVKGDTVGETEDDTVFEMFDDTGLLDPPGMRGIDWSLFPNPATTFFRVVSSEPLDEVRIIDMQGRTVRAAVGVRSGHVEIVGLAFGSYTVFAIGTNGSRTSQPLIIAPY